jgi:curli biogenesis system outer membrane secretion channel CsgG
LFRKKWLGRILMLIVALVFATQAVYAGTTAFTEVKVKEKAQAQECAKEPEVIIHQEKEDDIYSQERLEKIARDYQVDYEYLKYLSEVEKNFNLEPYELFALIASESAFIPITKMDGGSLSYNTTQMKLVTAEAVYKIITENYQMEIPYPNGELLEKDKNYAALLAGGYLRYLRDLYESKEESYTAYQMGMSGRLNYYQKHGDYWSPYAVKIDALRQSFLELPASSRSI